MKRKTEKVIKLGSNILEMLFILTEFGGYKMALDAKILSFSSSFFLFSLDAHCRGKNFVKYLCDDGDQ